MTNELRESLTRRAHAVEPPALDVHALVSVGEKRLRRRRFGAVAGSVLAVALAVGVPAVIWDLRDEPKSVQQPEVPPAPSISILKPETAREIQDRLRSDNPQGLLAPGKYVVDVEGLRPRPVVELPSGFRFDTHIDMAAFKGFGLPDCALSKLACFSTRDEEREGMRGGRLKVGFWNGEQIKVHPDLCGKFEDFKRPGPSVRDLATILAGLPGFRASTPAPVSLGGYEGLYVELVTVAPPCEAFWLTGRTTGLADDSGPGHVERLWVLEVEGGRIVVEASHAAGATDDQVAALTRIVESITFEHTD